MAALPDAEREVLSGAMLLWMMERLGMNLFETLDKSE